MSSSALLSTIQYFPCIGLFSLLRHQNILLIEQHETYQKGSFRNRCLIKAANGVQNLSVPLVKGKHQSTPIREVKISYVSDWQQNHWRSIQSAYGSAPYFPFYEDEIKDIIFSEHTNLFDLCLQSLQWAIRSLRLDKEITFTEQYETTYDLPVVDARADLTPKTQMTSLESDVKNQLLPYPSIFINESNLVPSKISILDLIFITGPEAMVYLR